MRTFAFASVRWSVRSLCLFVRALYARDQPIESLEQALSLQRRGFLDGPLSVSDLRQSQGVADLLGVHRALLVLLVGKDQQDGGQFPLGDRHTLRIGAVDHENDGVRVGIVAPPIGTNAGLPSKIPHLELPIRWVSVQFNFMRRTIHGSIN
jgi:hypothetical protein